MEIPHSKGLDGHSDADVLIHAIADALLGTVGAGDIGHHFPNTDESIRGIRSMDILSRVVDILAGHDARIINVDATLIAEAPKIAPHLDAMRASLAECLRLPLSRVSIKATTNERLGFPRTRARASRRWRSPASSEDEAAIDPETAPPVPVVGPLTCFRDAVDLSCRSWPPRLFNTYSRQLEEFAPLDPDTRTVKLYTCGPTVYSYAHIGNFRAYIFEDLLQRHLEARGYHVHRVMNLTDVDDKTIRGCRSAGVALARVHRAVQEGVFRRPEGVAHQARRSVPRGDRAAVHRAHDRDDRHARGARLRLPGRGRQRLLPHQAVPRLRQARASRPGPTAPQRTRAAATSTRRKASAISRCGKRGTRPTATWAGTARGDADGPAGTSSAARWPARCSATRSTSIAAARTTFSRTTKPRSRRPRRVTGKKFVRYWMHCKHLMVDGQKMSKSLGNFYTLRDVLAKGYTGREVRYALLRVNYGLPLNFTFDGMADARAALRRIDAWVARLQPTTPPRCDAASRIRWRTTNASSRRSTTT